MRACRRKHHHSYTIPVKLKEMRRLETLEERDERKAAYAEAKCIEYEKRGEFWVTTVHPMVEFCTQATGLNKSITDAASPNCLLGLHHISASSKNPHVFISCIEITRKKVSGEKKVCVAVGMLAKLCSDANSVVLLDLIIMH